MCHFHSYSRTPRRIQNQQRSNTFMTDDGEGLAAFQVQTVEHATSDLGKSGIIWWLKTQTRTERGGNSDGISANVERRGIRALASRGMWSWGALPFNRLVAECAAWKSWLINGLMWQYGLLKSPRPIQFLVELIDCRNQTPGWRTPKWITHGN